MILPESLGNGQGPSPPQTEALRATIKASTVPDSRPFRVRLQVHQRSPWWCGSVGGMEGLPRAVLLLSFC